jgi:23S rRNA (adenine2503-C2)-methyltransferase
MTCIPDGDCWCAQLPHGPVAANPSGCLCPACLSQGLGYTVDLLGKSDAELRAWMSAFGEPNYRGSQLYQSIYSGRRFDFAGMSDLPASLRERISRAARIAVPEISRRYRSSDSSVRYLLSLPSSLNSGGTSPIPARVETVFMPSEGRQTICISTQAGCAVDCRFCLTAQLGLIRNLTAGEIVGQVLLALEDHRDSLAPRTNVVFMGQGEPLLNFEPVIAAVRIMLDPRGMALAPRHVTLSTSGIVPGIDRLAQEKIRPKLAVSLNASSDEQRDAIMPINKKYPLADLLAACRRYTLGNREWITFEYVLLGGLNDTPADARRVARLVSGLRAKINLIPWNPGALPFHAPESDGVEKFRNVLVEKGIPAFVRYSRGRDIAAACGQLALIETPMTSGAASVASSV